MTDWLTDFEHVAIAVVKSFTAWVRSFRLSQPQPPIFLSRKEGDSMAWQFTFQNPPANTAPDWTKREFVANVDGVESVTLIDPKDSAEPIVLTFPENASVSLKTRDYDDAQPTPLSRDSEPVEFLVTDDVPPDVPGGPIFVSKVEVP